MILKLVQTGARSLAKVVQVGGAYTNSSKFAGLLSAMYRHFAYVHLKLKDLLILV